MARKLTDVERMNLDYLRETLCQVLEPSQKNKAASVASALVRVRGDVVTDAAGSMTTLIMVGLRD